MNAHDLGEVPAGVATDSVALQHVPPDLTLPVSLSPRDLVQMCPHHQHSVRSAFSTSLGIKYYTLFKGHLGSKWG